MSFVIRELQIKTKMIHYYLHITMAKAKNLIILTAGNYAEE